MSDPAVTVVDYGVGNLLSVRRAFEAAGARVILTGDPAAIVRAERLVLPGVGAFGDCMAGIRRQGLVEPLLEFARNGRPFIGICVGMQVLLEVSEEFGSHPGLGMIAGRVREIERTDADGAPHKIPHIGWAPLAVPAARSETGWADSPLADLAPGARVYFVHSFTAEPDYEADRLADAYYNGSRICAAVQRGPVVGMQFHPEKSGPVGLAIIRRFLGG